MNNYQNIQNKLHGFIKKYYTNEIIKGSIFFLSFGLLYFIFTLFVEYFLWLQPIARTILFWLFVIVELGLVTKFIFIPLAKLIGFQDGISSEEASKIIGKYFTQVDDKLLNILQLNSEKEQSELLLASIEQKSAEINPVPFKKAINFSTNKKYIKYLSLPLLVWLFAFFTGNNSIFTSSFDRVVHYKTPYQPPAPFYFQIMNNNLQVIEGKPFNLRVETIGDIVPQHVKIIFDDQTYLLNNNDINTFSYNFERVDQSFSFYIEANEIRSQNYQINSISTPTILDFEMHINYPGYIHKTDVVIKNTGDASVPEGTQITWKLKTKSTDTVKFTVVNQTSKFEKVNSNSFVLSKNILKPIPYKISSSNRDLKEYEVLTYQIKTIKDNYPQIKIKTDIESITRGQTHFIGQVSDDYGLEKLQVVYKESGNSISNFKNLKIQKTTFEEFFYTFPDDISLKNGATYEIYFEVFDNDAIHGSKSVKSPTFYYNQKTREQITEDILKEQQENFNEIQKTQEKREDLNKMLEDFNNKLKNKEEIGWNEKKDLDQYLQRQKMYQEMLKKNADKILENLDELEIDDDKNLSDKKEILKDRIEELKELEKNTKLLDELKKLTEKLKKEGLIDNLDKLTENNKQQNRSLERILELTKRFYVEKKFNDISKDLEKLSNKQDQLSKEKTKNNSENQNELNKKFDSIQDDFNELNEQNNNLKQPISLPETKDEENQIKNEMEQAKTNLKQNENNKRSIGNKSSIKNQKSAAQKMRSLSQKMQNAMQQMEAESISENINDLQQVLDNLIRFSLDQESLMLSFDQTDASNADFSQKLIKQQVLKEYFGHIDDSLYTLSMRLIRLSSKIQTDLSSAHYNIDKSLDNISDNKIKQGIVNQRYTMTAANSLADLLSNILQNLQDKKNSSGKGKGKKGESISLPDIIKKQNDLLKKTQDGLQEKNNSGKLKNEQMSGEQYQIYKEQNQLKEALQRLMKEQNNSSAFSKRAVMQMEELEKILLEKGFNNQVIERMKQLNHELLKLENASFDKGINKKRKSDTGKEIFQNKTIDQLELKNLYFNPEEVLIRKTIPLQPFYQKRVIHYFKEI